MGKRRKTGKGIWWSLILLMAIGFSVWLYWGNLDRRPKAGKVKLPIAGKSEPGRNAAGQMVSPPRKPAPSPSARREEMDPEETRLLLMIKQKDAAGRPEEAIRARFELSDHYLHQALWEWTERVSEPDAGLIRKTLGILEGVIERNPGTEWAAAAQLKKARVYRNGMSGLWDRDHEKEARAELTKVLENYPRSASAREARQLLAEIVQ